jgi:NAD(P)-dependent dehydrogenase (short-subunit alcohol dehydrogenase family)
MKRLDGTVVIVTGAGSGQGLATANRAAAEGAIVAVVDLRAEAAEQTASLLRSTGARAEHYALDVSDPEAVTKLFSDVERDLGMPTVLMNIAGIYDGGNIVDTPLDEFERVFAVNVRGPWLCSQALIRRLREAGNPGGAIVSIASVNVTFTEPDSPAYCASKGAVYSLTKALAFDHAKEGVQINCISPGWIETGMTAEFLDDEAKRQIANAGHAVGRVGQPAEIAAAAVFLASSDASFCHGADLVVDGGMSIGRDLFS